MAELWEFEGVVILFITLSALVPYIISPREASGGMSVYLFVLFCFFFMVFFCLLAGFSLNIHIAVTALRVVVVNYYF